MRIYVLYTCDEWKSRDSMRVASVSASLRKTGKAVLGAVSGGTVPGLTAEEKKDLRGKVRDIFAHTIPEMVCEEINRIFSGSLYLEMWYD